MGCRKHFEDKACVVCAMEDNTKKIENNTKAIVDKLDQINTVMHTGKVNKLNLEDLNMINRRMWHECNIWVKIKRAIAGLITIPILLFCFAILYTFRLICNLMVYAGGGYWQWKWKF